MFLERMHQIHIGPSLVYPGVGQVSHLSIDYTTTTDSYSTFVTIELRKFRSQQPTPLNSMSGSWSKRPRFGNPPYTHPPVQRTKDHSRAAQT